MDYEGRSYGSGATIEKLDAHKRYADAYTRALLRQPSEEEPFTLYYVDAFAGRGEVLIPGSTETLPGSAQQALETTRRPFDRLLFIDDDQQSCERLREIVGERGDSGRTEVIHGDANVEISNFCSWLKGEEARMHRAFVFVDPYAMQFSWDSVQSVAETKRADMLMLFPLMAVRRNAKIDDWPIQEHDTALTRFFGDESWRSLYTRSGSRGIREGGDKEIVRRYAERLESVFEEVVDPERTLGSADDGSLFTMLFGASNPAGAKVAANIAKGVFVAATGVQGRMRL